VENTQQIAIANNEYVCKPALGAATLAVQFWGTPQRQASNGKGWTGGQTTLLVVFVVSKILKLAL